MRTPLLLLLISMLMLSASFGFAQSNQQGLHLIVGYAVGQLELEGGRFKEESYLSNGFATSFAYQIQSFAVGIKSIASLGTHNRQENTALSDSDKLLRRYVQHMSLTPYVSMRQDISTALPFGLLFELGPTSAITSFWHKDVYEDREGLRRRKSSFESQGYEFALGLYSKSKPDSGDFNLMFSYQSLQSEKQYLVDVTRFKNAVTLSKQDSYDVSDLEVYSLVLNYYLF